MNIPNSKFTRIIPLVLSSLIIYLLFQQIDFRQVSSTLRKCDLRIFFFASFISLSLNIGLGSFKWHKILNASGCSLPYSTVIWVFAGCIPFKLFMPMKSAELLKAIYLEKKHGLTFSRGLSSVAMDKMLNLLVLLCLAIGGLLFSGLAFPPYVLPPIFVFLMCFLFSARLRSLIIFTTRSIHPKLHKETTDLFGSFDEIGKKDKGLLIMYSFIYQLSEFINTYLLFKALGVTIPFPLLLTVIPLFMVINSLPVTILGLGTREASMIFFLSAYAPAPALLGGSLLVTLVEYVLPVVGGLLYIIGRRSTSLTD